MLRTLPYNSADPRWGIKADLNGREEHLLREILFATTMTSTAAWAREPSLQTAPTELLNWRIQKLIFAAAIAMTKLSVSRLVFSSIS